MPDLAEAPVTETVEAPPEVVETPTAETPEAPAEVTPPAEPVHTEQEKQDARVLSNDERNLLKEVQAKNPKLAGLLKDKLFTLAAFAKHFPGGVKEVAGFMAAKAEIDELAGEGGIEGLKAEQQEWREIDDQFTKGDPRFVDAIIANNPQSFQKMMPHAMNKFAELAPEQYQHVMSGVIVNTLRESGALNGALNTLQRIGDLMHRKFKIPRHSNWRKQRFFGATILKRRAGTPRKEAKRSLCCSRAVVVDRIAESRRGSAYQDPGFGSMD